MKKIRRRKKPGLKRRQADRPRLSVCTIVKNESGRMAGFLKSVDGLADETVVVDTGSEDGSMEIARSMGAVVVSHPWNDDFSEVRNASILNASGDWVLALDADEAVHPRDFPALRRAIERAEADAYRMLTRNYSDFIYSAGWRRCGREYPDMERGFTGWYPTVKVRLFRRSEGTLFEGCVHELVESSVLENGGTIGNLPLPIHHFGARPTDSRKEKGEFYLRLGRKKVAQRPSDPRAHFELGIQHLELGELCEAESMLRKSVALQEGMPPEKLLALYHSPPEAHNMLGVTLERLGREEEALAQYQRAVELNPECVEALTNWGLVLERRGRAEQARSKYLEALKISPADAALKSHLARIDSVLS